MSELEREREKEKIEKEEVRDVQLFTEKVLLRSSDSFVLSGDILFTMFPKELSFISSFLPFFSASFLPNLNSDFPKFSPNPVQVSQAKKKKKNPDSNRNA